MATTGRITVVLLVPVLLSISGTAQAQLQRAASPASRSATRAETRLTGVYRLDVESSDKLYSVLTGASSNLPFGEQQRFFIVIKTFGEDMKGLSLKQWLDYRRCARDEPPRAQLRYGQVLNDIQADSRSAAYI